MEKEATGKRKFNFNWLAKHPWLVYSKLMDGCYCFPCLLFGMRVGHNSGKLTKLFLEPLTLWTSAASKLSAHELGKCDLHKCSVLAIQEFRQIMESKSLLVVEFQSRGEMNRVKENEKILKSIFKTIILCRQENIPLRDDSQHYGTDQVGKFQRLLDFRVDVETKFLKIILSMPRELLLIDQNRSKMK